MKIYDGSIVSAVAQYLFGSSGPALFATMTWMAISGGIAGEIIALR
jgi:hypothetical protein